MYEAAGRLRLASLAALAMGLGLTSARTASAQMLDTIPSQIYYAGVEELYRGDFRDALRTFNRALRGSVKTLNAGGAVRWIDSICYHAMLGEVYYHWGQPAEALEQYNFACTLYLQYPRWMLRAQFTQQLVADTSIARMTVPWGVSQRAGTPGRFPDTVAVAQGQLDNSRAIQQGGPVMQPQLWPVDVVAVNRCTALAIRRRNEILGPLGAHDSLSKTLAVTLARGGAPPNHWSNAWIEVLRGLALAGIGDDDQALQLLERGQLAAGQFDHPLTGVSLLEQGRIALAKGDYGTAALFFNEAGYAAFLYGDLATIDDSFRLGAVNRLAANVSDVDPALQAAATSARRDRLDYIAARCQLALSDQLMSVGDWKTALPALSAGVALLGDARTGVLGNLAMYLEARLEYQQGRPSAAVKMANALQGQQKISLTNFQIRLANDMFDAQTLPTRVAGPVYESLLHDQTPAEAVLRPLESMAVMTTPHEPAFHRWILTALDRRNLAYAVEVTERAKRRRFHNVLPWGGRLNAVRDLLAAPQEQLTAEQQRQQGDVLRRFPEVANSLAAEQQLQAQLDQTWRPPLTDDAKEKSTRLWEDYSRAIANREQQLARVGAARVPAEISFPPFLPALELQQRLQPGQALLVFHDTPEGLLGILLTAKASASWNAGPSARLTPLLSDFLRDIGNIDGNHEVATSDLAGNKWQESSAKLYQTLFEGSSLAPSAVTDLIIIPDGITWYVPFEALMAEVDGQLVSLISCAKIRYAPTAGLAFDFRGPWRRVKRTGVAIGEPVPGEKPEQRLQFAAPLQQTLEGSLVLAPPSPAPSPALATMLDAMVVLDDVNLVTGNPFEWTPLPVDPRAERGAVGGWMAIPSDGPQRVALPAMHTAAERGGKSARRRGESGGLPGDELFFASCTLMSAGAETALLSRWRVGGQSMLDMVREFMQELPMTPAAEAWQRSVQLAADRPIDPITELRVKSGSAPQQITAAHPFFWAGYMVIDTGWQPEELEAAVEPTEPMAAAPPGAPPQQPAGGAVAAAGAKPAATPPAATTPPAGDESDQASTATPPPKPQPPAPEKP